MSRNEEFAQGHTPLSEYLDLAQSRPTHATARELVRKSVPADLGLVEDERGNMYRPFGDHHDSPEDVMTRKYASAQKKGLVEDILNRGVINPVRMVPDGAWASERTYRAAKSKDAPQVPLMWNGQHRVAVMYKHAPDQPIPLEWGSFEEFESSPRNRQYNKTIPTSDKPVTLPKRPSKKKPA